LAISDVLLPWLAVVTALLLAAGLWLGFHVPPDHQLGMTITLVFIHAPAALTAETAYAAIAVCSIFLMVNRRILADVAACAAAPLGASFTALALITGSLWAKPMWGAFWVWDARLTSFLLL
jgi:heme exporter protein C